jgi:hypothetical protein
MGHAPGALMALKPTSEEVAEEEEEEEYYRSTASFFFSYVWCAFV